MLKFVEVTSCDNSGYRDFISVEGITQIRMFPDRVEIWFEPRGNHRELANPTDVELLIEQLKNS